MKTFDDFSQEIGFNKGVLDNYITFSDCYYNTYSICKRNKSKKRIIESPSKEVKAIQRWVLHNYFETISVSNRANGFVKTRGIKRNASMHLNKKYLLSIDIKDFFTSISQSKVFNVLLKHFSDKKLAFKLSKLCTYKRRLPQGAPTSPILSNIIFNELDDKMSNMCNAKSITYSRYADDLVFSSNIKSVLVDILPIINDLLFANGFLLNTSKTKFFSGKGRMHVTGINLNDGRLTVNSVLKHRVRSQLFHIIVKKDAAINKNQTLGYLSFIKDIEPEYYKKMIKYIECLKNKSLNIN